MEEIVLISDKTRGTYVYGGEGITRGAGASLTVYGGLVFNIDSPEEYSGPANSCGLTLSLGKVGITMDIFWPAISDPFEPDGPYGFTVGYSPGAQAAQWCTCAMYELTWSTREWFDLYK
jgi:hypothetical protein